MASVIDIYNRSLQLLGAKRVRIVNESTASARACNSCYEVLRDAELRKHPWNFAIKRATLAAESPAPEWGRSNSFVLPSDYLKLVAEYEERNSLALDYVIENGRILTNLSAPYYLRYVSRVTDVNKMDALFREALACSMATNMSEELTQSNSKIQTTAALYKTAIVEAKKANMFEKVAANPPESSWITCRR